MSDPFTMMLVMTAVQTGLQMAMAPKIKGPRSETKVSIADYGTPAPRFWGIRRFQTPIMWAETLREVKKTSKTKGGKYTEYKYYGTWANLVADQEIEAVTRIWFDKHLVYQSTGPGPIAAAFLSFVGQGTGAIVKLALGRNMRIYKGTESQLQDPRMESWCEDKYGADSCPAYRGVAYVVFEEIPLEKLGNHLPQVTIEAVSASASSYPYETFTGGYAPDKMYFSPDFTRFFIGSSSGGYQVWDTASRTLLYSGSQNTAAVAVQNDGSFYYRDGDVYRVGEGGSFGSVLTNPGLECGGNLFKAGGAIWADGSIGSTDACLLAFSTSEVINYDVGFRSTYYFTDEDDNAWATGELPTADGFGIAKVLDFDATKNFFISTGDSGVGYAMDNGQGQFFCWQNQNLYLVNKDTGAIEAGPVAAPSFNANDDSVIMRGVPPGSQTVWIGFSEVSTTTLATIRTLSTASWSGSSGEQDPVYDPVNNAIWTKETLGSLTVRYLDRVSSNGVTLQTIVDDVSTWCGLTGQDTTTLTQIVKGYSVTQGSGKDMIAPLLDIHDVDARPHDFVVQFVNRGSAPSGTIETPDFVRDGDSARYSVSVQQDTDVARKVTFNYADANKDQQTNTAIAQRPLDAVDSNREETIDLTTYVATPDEAQRLAERFFRRQWNSRERPKNAVTAQLLALEPGDVRTLSLDGVLRNARLDRMTIRGSSIDCEWVRDETSFSALSTSTGAPMDGRDDEEIFIPTPVRGFILDTPLVADADNDVNPVIYYAAGPYLTTFGGAAVYRGDDGTYDETFAFIDSTQGATWGFTDDVLGDANPHLWDRGNTVSVNVFNGTLTTVTEADIDADPTVNLCAIGDNGRWEFVNFTTATLTGTNGEANVYTLSGFKRGRRGTEMNTANHAIGDGFLFNPGALNAGLGMDDVEDALSFKVQSVGRDPDSAGAIDLDPYTGASLKPYAPARIKWTTDGTDMFGEIIRRTRVGGTWADSGTVSLSENTEAYEVDILDGSDNVLRTITVSGTNLFTYTGAEITADSGSVGVVPPYNAYQMSDSVGRGFALAA